METLSPRQVRRLALARAGLLQPALTGLPRRAAGAGRRARRAAHEVIRRFGYLQLDSIPVAGARTQGIVLLSRLEGFEPALAEELLAPGEPLFEYWGHEASWLPMELYPALEFRRREFRVHPWWGDLLGEHPDLARRLVERIEREGPLRSLDFEHEERARKKLTRQLIAALWSAGEIAVRQRRAFHRSWDLAERVIPEEVRARPLSRDESLRVLLLKALDGHGWATAGTLAATWRFRNMRQELTAALGELRDAGEIVPAAALDNEGRSSPGFIRPADLELAARLERARPRRDRGVLLSPFDPLLWDRDRVRRFFSFEQVLEIYKPAKDRLYGYYCLPVLAGDQLVGRVDLKAERARGKLVVLSRHDEEVPSRWAAAQRAAIAGALERFATALGLDLETA